jgi:putative spermidine/putrescine transport system substrate-binding protein
MVRKILLAVLVLVLAAGAAFYWYTRPLPILTVTTWPGAYGRAQASSLMRPFATEKHVDVRIAQWEGDLKEVAAAAATHVYKGDVIDFELPKAVDACARGLLEKIDAASLPPGADGAPAAKDFVPGAIGPCWVGSIVYSQMIAFHPGAGWFTAPDRAADFFDPVHYPGMRAVSRASPKFVLELALLADGVAPGQVYATLSSDEGLARAFAKLESLKGHLVWLASPSDAIPALRTGRAVFALANNGDLFDWAQKGFSPGIIWDRQLYELDVFGIPAGDPKKERALDFIRFATGSAPLAGVAGWVPYGPARHSALALVGDNPDLHIPMKNWLPTAHFETAFAVDDGWWRAHEAAIAPRWQAWADAH